VGSRADQLICSSFHWESKIRREDLSHAAIRAWNSFFERPMLPDWSLPAMLRFDLIYFRRFLTARAPVHGCRKRKSWWKYDYAGALSCVPVSQRRRQAGVSDLAAKLEERGLACWLDEWNLIPGNPWQPAIEEALGQCDTCLVFFGPHGLGPWHNEEMRLALQRRVNSSDRKLRVLPIILPGRPTRQRERTTRLSAVARKVR
jgi:hypothetical protein